LARARPRHDRGHHRVSISAEQPTAFFPSICWQLIGYSWLPKKDIFTLGKLGKSEYI